MPWWAPWAGDEPAAEEPGKSAATFSQPQKMQPEPRVQLNSARAKIGNASDPLAYGGSGREHPGRIMTPHRRIGAAHGASTSTPGPRRKRPVGPGGRTIPKHGDAALKLKLEGLNGFEAMMATMKEMGYESEEEEEEEEADIETGNAVESASPPQATTAAAPTTTATVQNPSEAPSVSTAASADAKDSITQNPTPRSRSGRVVLAIIVLVVLLCAAAAAAIVVAANGDGGLGFRRLQS